MTTITGLVKTKTDNNTLIALQTNTTAPRVTISSELNTTNILVTTIGTHLGRVTTNAFTAGVNFRIEGSTTPSGNGYWFPITIFTSAVGTNIGSQTISSNASAGQNIVSIGATANFVVGDIVYIQNTTEANSEFGRIKAVSLNANITLEDNLRFAQPTTSTVTSKSEMYYALIDTSAIKRLRCVSDGSGTGQNFDCEIIAVTGT